MLIFSYALIRNIERPIVNLFRNITTKSKYGPTVVAVLPIVIFASICFAWAYTSRARKRKEKVRPVLTRSLSIGTLHGGRLALQRLMDYRDACADVNVLDAAEAELETSLAEERPDFKKLQRTVAKLEMSGKEDKAIGILEMAMRKAQKEEKSFEAYEIQMLLVEMLIYKGDFEKALHCECLNDEKISDARRPLYKAIIHILVDHPKEEATKCWEDFKEIRRHFQSPPSLQDSRLHEATVNFYKFEKAVKLLKHDIREACT
ncbi:hypothetical protein L1049_010694 [Liquidambar formosana]|uniref:Uncharacterized protein n=1 Tax=Liquidambar formosana TaxID=63359 RepID=A0AAP0NAA4_LIQFO